MTAGKAYRPTQSKYKGGAHTCDLDQRTRGGQRALYPKVKRVYIAGNVKDWKTGILRNKLGREGHGVRIEYEHTRRGYRRQGYTAHRGETEYAAGATGRRDHRPAVRAGGGDPGDRTKRAFLSGRYGIAGEIPRSAAARPIDQHARKRGFSDNGMDLARHPKNRPEGISGGNVGRLGLCLIGHRAADI